MDLPKRKNMRLEGYNYSLFGAYFVTICVAKRNALLCDCVRPHEPHKLSDMGVIVNNEIQTLSRIYENIYVNKYCIMPDHIHMIIFIMPDQNERPNHLNADEHSSQLQAEKIAVFVPTLSRIIKQFKGSITKQIGFSIWQKSFYDRIIRNEKEYQEIWQYIEENPHNPPR